jgi:hypothetical protein
VLRIIRKYDLQQPVHRTSAKLALSAQLPDLVACPLCHTEVSGASARFAWQCRRCGQRWTPLRIETVAAYAAWLKVREPSCDASATLGEPADGRVVSAMSNEILPSLLIPVLQASILSEGDARNSVGPQFP